MTQGRQTTAVTDAERERARAFALVEGMQAGTVHVDTSPERFRFLRIEEVLSIRAPRWRVRDVIPERGLAVVYGASGSGKTFTVLDMAAAVALGEPWCGRRTRAAGVAYIAAEGHLRDRIDAYLRHHGLAGIDRLRILNSSVNLLHGELDLPFLLDGLRAVETDLGDVGLVVIDTLNRVMPGGDENSGEDMGRIVANAKAIEDAFGCAVLFVHHSGKVAANGSRGHSSLKASADAEISVIRDGDIRTVTAEKVRDGADGVVLSTFRLASVDLGPMSDIDPDADHMERRTSCVVESIHGASELGSPRRTARLSDVDQIALQALRDACEASGTRTEATTVHAAGLPLAKVDVWRDRFRRTRGIDEADSKAMDASKKAFQRSVDKLTASRLAGVHGGRAWLF